MYLSHTTSPIQPLTRAAMTTMTFDSLLDEIDALPADRQEELLDIVRRRLAERRRGEIAANAREARTLYTQGALQQGSVDDLLRQVEDDAE
jgi:hypothetical protein